MNFRFGHSFARANFHVCFKGPDLHNFQSKQNSSKPCFLLGADHLYGVCHPLAEAGCHIGSRFLRRGVRNHYMPSFSGAHRSKDSLRRKNSGDWAKNTF